MRTSTIAILLFMHLSLMYLIWNQHLFYIDFDKVSRWEISLRTQEIAMSKISLFQFSLTHKQTHCVQQLFHNTSLLSVAILFKENKKFFLTVFLLILHSPSFLLSPGFTTAYSAEVDVKDNLTQHTRAHTQHAHTERRQRASGQRSADRKRRERKSSILIQEEVEKVRGLKRKTDTQRQEDIRERQQRESE